MQKSLGQPLSITVEGYMMKPYWPNSDTHSKYNELAACTTTYRGDGYSFLLPSAEVLRNQNYKSIILALFWQVFYRFDVMRARNKIQFERSLALWGSYLNSLQRPSNELLWFYLVVEFEDVPAPVKQIWFQKYFCHIYCLNIVPLS